MSFTQLPYMLTSDIPSYGNQGIITGAMVLLGVTDLTQFSPVFPLMFLVEDPAQDPHCSELSTLFSVLQFVMGPQSVCVSMTWTFLKSTGQFLCRLPLNLALLFSPLRSRLCIFTKNYHKT